MSDRRPTGTVPRRVTRANPDLNSSHQSVDPNTQPPPPYHLATSEPSNVFRPSTQPVMRTPPPIQPAIGTPQSPIRPVVLPRPADLERVRQELFLEGRGEVGATAAATFPLGCDTRHPPPLTSGVSRESLNMMGTSELAWDPFMDFRPRQGPDRETARQVANLETQMLELREMIRNLSLPSTRPNILPLQNHQVQNHQPRNDERHNEGIYRQNHLVQNHQPRNYDRRNEDNHRQTPDQLIRSRSPVSRWQLNYDGTSASMSIEDFLYRLDKFKNLERISDEYVTQNLYRMLSGVAVRWYWIYEKDHPNASWLAYRNALLTRFRGTPGADQDDRIISELISRKQGPRETVDEFYTAVLEINNRLNVRRSEAALINIMRQNLLPKLSDAVLTTPFRSLDEFRSVCHMVEMHKAKLQQQRYEARTGQGVHCIGNESEEEAVEAVHTRSDRRNRAPPNTLKWTCWNCDQIGHSYRECDLDHQGIFCYTCGQKGVVSPKCDRCHPKNEGVPARIGDRRQQSVVPSLNVRPPLQKPQQ